MFPLGLVLLPGMTLPLRLFEPRYLQMYADIIDSDRTFGVVLIERGLESRDDNLTFGTGCTAHILGSGINEDGTIGIIAIGRQRIRIEEWLEPDPYPRAMVTELEDDPLTDAGRRAVQEAMDQVPGLLGVAAELNPELSPIPPELADDPEQAIYQMAQLAGLPSWDMQKVLEAPSSDSRASLVNEMLAETVELIRLQLEVGGG